MHFGPTYPSFRASVGQKHHWKGISRRLRNQDFYRTQVSMCPRGDACYINAWPIEECRVIWFSPTWEYRAHEYFGDGLSDFGVGSCWMNTKKRVTFVILFRAAGETRTHTGQRPLPPQSSVSTISPLPQFYFGTANIITFLQFPNFFKQINKYFGKDIEPVMKCATL